MAALLASVFNVILPLVANGNLGPLLGNHLPGPRLEDPCASTRVSMHERAACMSAQRSAHMSTKPSRCAGRAAPCVTLCATPLGVQKGNTALQARRALAKPSPLARLSHERRLPARLAAVRSTPAARRSPDNSPPLARGMRRTVYVGSRVKAPRIGRLPRC